jgi:hypothetical protein
LPVPDGTPTQRRTSGAAEPPARPEATDPTGAVRVVLDDRGRVLQVEVSPRWRDRLDVPGLLTALLETYREAGSNAVGAFLAARRAARAAGQALPETGRDPAFRPETALPDPRTDREAWWRWLQDLRASAAAARAQRSRIEAAAGQGTREYTGSHGYLTATSDGTDVTGITGDPGAIWYAVTGDLQEDARDILSQVQRSQPNQ